MNVHKRGVDTVRGGAGHQTDYQHSGLITSVGSSVRLQRLSIAFGAKVELFPVDLARLDELFDLPLVETQG